MKHLSDLLSSTAVVQFVTSADPEIGALQYDSRRVQQGDCFFAVRGTQSDGHNYITSAVKQGAVAVVCEALPEALSEGVSYVVVEDSNKAMADMAAAFYDYPSEELELVGVTGTNGKTTVTYLLKSVLEKVYGAKVGLIGTIQNMIGDKVIETERTTPESFELQGLFARMRDAGCTHVVMEVSSHALTLDRVGGVPVSYTHLTLPTMAVV